MCAARIELKDIEKTYRPEKLLPLTKELPRGSGGRKGGIAKVLRGITLDIIEGQNIGIVGESGCGKTTTMKIVVDMLQPDKRAGSVTFVSDDRRMTWRRMWLGRKRRFRNRVQYVFQHPGDVLSPGRKASDIVSEGYFSYLALKKGILYALRTRLSFARHLLLRGRDVLPEIEELMQEDLELGPEQMRAYASELSGGEKKRLLLAKSFASMGKLSNVTIRRAAGEVMGGDEASAGPRDRRRAVRLLNLVDEDFLRIAVQEELAELARRLARLFSSEHGVFALAPEQASALLDGAAGVRMLNEEQLAETAARLRARREEIEGPFEDMPESAESAEVFSQDMVCEQVAEWLRPGPEREAEGMPRLSRRQVADALEGELVNFLADLSELRLPITSEYQIMGLDRGALKELLSREEGPELATPESLLSSNGENLLTRMLEEKVGQIRDAVKGRSGRGFPFPKFLILDEPMRGIDSVNKLKIVRDLQQTRGAITLITITHDIRILAPLSDRIVVMYGGLIQEISDREDLPLSPDSPESMFDEIHPYTAALIQGEYQAGVKLEIPVPEETGPGALGQGCIFRFFCPKFRERRVTDEVKTRCEAEEPPLVRIERPGRSPRHLRCWAAGVGANPAGESAK